MDRVLVVGASGLLGGRMMELYAQDYDVCGTYVKHNINPAFKNSYRLDATQKDDAVRLIKRLKPDVIIDAHGMTSVDYCETHQEEALRVNVEGTKNLAEGAKEIGCKYILISTNGVFDGEKKTPYTENDKPNPINHYGVTKLMAEKVVESLGMGHIIARTSMLFGKGGSREVLSFPKLVMEKLTKKQILSVVTDQYSNPTYTDNLAEFARRLYEKGASGIFNTAGKDVMSRFEFANRIADAFGLDKSLITPVSTAELSLPARRPLMLGLDISKAEKVASMKGMSVDAALNAFRSA